MINLIMYNTYHRRTWIDVWWETKRCTFTYLALLTLDFRILHSLEDILGVLPAFIRLPLEMSEP